MTKILFVARESDGVSTGASLITERNFELLKQVYGALSIQCFWINQNNSRSSQFFNMLQMNLSGLNNTSLFSLLSVIREGEYKEVFIDNSLLGKLCPIIKKEFPSIKLTLFFHNVESDYFHRLMRSSKKFWHILSIIATKHNEQLGCSYADELVFLNNRDATRAMELYRVKEGKNYRLLPTSMKDRFLEQQCLKETSNDRLSILFVGTLFFSNYHGIKWFANNVLPFINAELIIVGRGFESVANKFLNSNIKVVGTVENIDSYYYNADLVIAPIFQGSGMKTKLTEALMFGKQIIGTKEAFEGYDIDISLMGYLCNTADDFINTINRNQFKKYNPQSREVFLNNYDSRVSINKITKAPTKYIKEKKMVFAELARTGLVHNGINTSLVEVFRTYFQIKRLDFWGEVTHVNSLNLADTNFLPFKVFKGSLSEGFLKKISLLFRELGFIVAWFRLLFFIRKQNADMVVITSILPLVHLLMKYTVRFVPSKTNVYVVLHGEVENIEAHKNMYYNFLARAINYNSGIDNRFKYIVLANYIKSNLLKSFQLKEESTLSIPHPYQFNHTKVTTSTNINKPIIFGAIGVQTKLVKQSHLIFELANWFKPQIENRTIEFRIIGVLDDNMKPHANQLVKVITATNGMLSKSDFDNEVSALDYVLFFAPSGAYRFTASGTVLDALKYQIPIVGLKNECLKELFEQSGQIGYLADDIDDMKKIIESLINEPNKIAYELAREKMLKAQSLFTVVNAVNSLKSQE